MRHFVKSAIRFLKKEDGATAVECALMLALVVVICIVAINTAASQGRDRVTQPVVVDVQQQ